MKTKKLTRKELAEVLGVKLEELNLLRIAFIQDGDEEISVNVQSQLEECSDY